MCKEIFPKNVLCKLYRGVVEPHFRYCCSVLGNCAESRLANTQNLQNRAARIITNSVFDAPAYALIKGLKWPTVRDMIRNETTTIIFNPIYNLKPYYPPTCSSDSLIAILSTFEMSKLTC